MHLLVLGHYRLENTNLLVIWCCRTSALTYNSVLPADPKGSSFIAVDYIWSRSVYQYVSSNVTENGCDVIADFDDINGTSMIIHFLCKPLNGNKLKMKFESKRVNSI